MEPQLNEHPKMSIVMENVSAADVMHLLDISKADQQWIADHKVKITAKATEVELGVGGITASFPMKLDKWAQLKAGNASSLVKSALKLQFNASLGKLKKGPAPEAAGESSVTPIASNTLKPATKPAGVAVGVGPINTAHQPHTLILEKSQMMMMEPCKLRDATMMYQPVKASSAGSRYFLVAAGQHLKVGVRYKENALSIRVEGPEWKSYVELMQSVGFTTIEHAQGYASMHLTVHDETLARKSLGAVLLGLNAQFTTPTPDLSLLKGMGS